MYYCFVSADFENLDHSNPLFIQSEYAKRIGKYICCDLARRIVVDKDDNEISISGNSVLLRASCETIDDAIEFLLYRGADLVERPDDIDKIEHWDNLSVVKRNIHTLSHEEILTRNFHEDFRAFLRKNEKVFIKSCKKGITIKTLSKYLLDGNNELLELIASLSKNNNDTFLCSKCYEIKKDSLGTKEARFFVLDNRIVNYSRMVHSIKHTVPKSLISAACEIVEIIHSSNLFPQNYVLDLAEFMDEDQKFIDVVEMNPISTSLCYINNSIFLETVPEIKNVKDYFQAGNEYCYDFLFNRERYVLDRLAGQNYEYIRTSDYCLF